MWKQREAPGALLLMLLLSIATVSHSGDVMVAAFNDGKISRFDGTTGAFINDYILGASPTPHALIVGPNCNLFVASFGGSKVLRYGVTSEPNGLPLPSATGTPGTAEFVAPGAGGLGSVGGMAFGPDDHLYVSSVSGSNVLRFDGTTGAFLDVFVPAGSGGLSGAELLRFGPDGDLYIPSGSNGAIMRYDGLTGSPKPGPLGPPGSAEFVPAGSLSDPHDFEFDANGDIYAASRGTGQVIKFDGTTGALLSVVVPAVTSPHGFAFGPTGNFYTASLSSVLIPEFDPSGTPLGTFINGAGIVSNIGDLVFVPDSCTLPVPVPDGTFGTPMTALRANAAGTAIRVFWDTSTCQGSDYNLLWGRLPIVRFFSLNDAVCDLGTSGVANWSGFSPFDIWFLIVSDDSSGTEGTWGTDSNGADRDGANASHMCGNLSRENSGTCPATP